MVVGEISVNGRNVLSHVEDQSTADTVRVTIHPQNIMGTLVR